MKRFPNEDVVYRREGRDELPRRKTSEPAITTTIHFSKEAGPAPTQPVDHFTPTRGSTSLCETVHDEPITFGLFEECRKYGTTKAYWHSSMLGGSRESEGGMVHWTSGTVWVSSKEMATGSRVNRRRVGGVGGENMVPARPGSGQWVEIAMRTRSAVVEEEMDGSQMNVDASPAIRALPVPGQRRKSRRGSSLQHWRFQRC